MPRVKKFWLEPIAGYNPWRDAGDCTFHQAVAERVCKWFPTHCSHSKGEFAGKPFVLSPWQKQIIGHLFGWKRPDGTRRFREFFLYVPKKNGKTQLAAGVALLLLTGDGEPGAEVYSASGDQDQAALIFQAARDMIDADEMMTEHIKVLNGYRLMKYEATGSFWKVLSSNAKTKHGPNIHGLIVDEMHVFSDSELIETLQRGTIARRQPLTGYLTTADHVRISPCNTMLEYGLKVRDGHLKDPAFMPIIYMADIDKDDWTSESTWRKANPGYGVTVKKSYFESEVAKAKQDPVKENSFKRLHLNMQTEKVNRWMDMQHWDQSGAKIESAALLGEPCYGGLDMSSVNDIAAFVLFFPVQNACLAWFWVPKETAEKRIEYAIWARDGYLEITPKRAIDQESVRAKINELSIQYSIKDIAYDSWNSAVLAENLQGDGLPMIEFRQGYKSMSEPTKALYADVVDHRLCHFGNPLLRWMASNAKAQNDDAGNVKLVKENKDSPLKIDGIIALVMARALAMREKEDEKSVFESSTEDMKKVLESIYG